MIELFYSTIFIRKMKKTDVELREEIIEKLELFKDSRNHNSLKVHKLHGELDGKYSFSVNYKFRVIFSYIQKNMVSILTFGDHDIYK